tara:strand:+ start:29323 stop:30219 length:897 start_codon:yes stop_codon:yes gene_type:complete
MLEYELRDNLLEAFNQLTLTIDALCDAILCDSTLVAWLQDIKDYPSLIKGKTSPREQVCSVIKRLEYFDTQQPREIIVAAGFIGASTETIELAEAVNLKKLHFKKSMLMLKAAKLNLKEKQISDGIQSILSKRPSSTSRALQNLNLARLHLKQCYRQLPILKHTPQKINWTWAHTRSIKKITAAKACEMLAQKGHHTHIELQLKKCQTLTPSEPLAIVQELAPHLRANIVFEENNQTKRLMIKGPLPIFFPATDQTPCPNFRPPKEKQDKNKNRVTRNDVRIDPEVFLPAIRAHRYTG